MLCNFSEYLKDRTKPQDLNALIKHAKPWVTMVTSELLDYQNQFSTEVVKNLLLTPADKNRILIHINKLSEKNIKLSEFIHSSDKYYNTLINTLDCIFQRQFQHNPLEKQKHFYAFEKIHSGVGLQFHIVDHSDTIINEFIIKAQSSIGDKEKKKKKSTSQGQKLTFSDELKKNLEKTEVNAQNIIDRRGPHAEDQFFSEHYTTMIDHIVKFSTENPGIIRHPTDELSLTHLSGARVEFILSSSVCGSCQHYFRALRHALNDKKIFIPIVIYAKSATNTTNVKDSVTYIDMSANYKMQNFSWKETDIKVEREQKRLINAQEGPLKEDIEEYSHFEQLGRSVLPLLQLNKSLATMFWKVLASYRGSSIYFEWLKEFTARLFNLFEKRTNPNENFFRDLPVGPDNCSDIPPDVFKIIHSKNFKPVGTEQLMPAKEAFFLILFGISDNEKYEPLTYIEYLYWTSFVEAAQNGKCTIGLGKDQKIFSIEDFSSIAIFVKKFEGLIPDENLENLIRKENNIPPDEDLDQGYEQNVQNKPN